MIETMHHPVVMIAQVGGESAFSGFALILFTMLCIGALLLLWVIALLLRQLYRFGREGMPWFLAIFLSLFFGAFGYWGWKLAGASVVIPVLVSFGLGKFMALHSKNPPKANGSNE